MIRRRSITQDGQPVWMNVPVGVFSVLLATAGAPEGVAAERAGMPGMPTTSALRGVSSDQALAFDSDLLNLGDGVLGPHVDLSYFAHKGGMQPGRYVVQVKVNGKMVDDGRRVNFRSFPDQPGKLYACVTAAQLAQWWGIIVTRSRKVTVNGHSSSGGPGETGNADNDTCPVGGVAALVPYAKEVFDFNAQLLSLTVPQASLGPASRLRTPPQMWNEGMPAILMNYNYSGSQ
ncbi:FimD/PapC N-terminal domain-containing protein, partial [Serratia marcescens]|uniref:FimD/PapC N-terminal domain-containing protein n=1 Tax=Serratia marcescens TaxID=615 RepID=UPI0024C4AEF2